MIFDTFPYSYLVQYSNFWLITAYETAHFVNAVDGGDMVDDCFEFGVRVNTEADFADYDVAVGLGIERLHREMEGVGYAIHEVYEEMAAVNGTHSQSYRVESCISIEFYRHYIVAV